MGMLILLLLEDTTVTTNPRPMATSTTPNTSATMGCLGQSTSTRSSTLGWTTRNMWPARRRRSVRVRNKVEGIATLLWLDGILIISNYFRFIFLYGASI